LVVTLIVALFVFELPARVSAGAITEGVVAGIFPVGFFGPLKYLQYYLE
jgi:lactate permease